MELKRVVFTDLDVNHAALLIKLRKIKVSQGDFFRFLVKSFIQEDEGLDPFLKKLVNECSSLGKRPKDSLRRATDLGREASRSLGLSDSEKEDIFDILELENFD